MPNGVQMVHNMDGACPAGSVDESSKLNERYLMMMSMMTIDASPPPPAPPPAAGVSLAALVVIIGFIILFIVAAFIIGIYNMNKSKSPPKSVTVEAKTETDRA